LSENDGAHNTKLETDQKNWLDDIAQKHKAGEVEHIGKLFQMLPNNLWKPFGTLQHHQQVLTMQLMKTEIIQEKRAKMD
jgi:hypothetical protein